MGYWDRTMDEIGNRQEWMSNLKDLIRRSREVKVAVLVEERWSSMKVKGVKEVANLIDESKSGARIWVLGQVDGVEVRLPEIRRV